MKFNYYLLIILIFVSCEQKKGDKLNVKTKQNSISKKNSSNNFKADKTKNRKETKIERWFEPTKIDTTLLFNKSHNLHIKSTDSITITEYYLKQNLIDSLMQKHNNSHALARDIEKHLLTTYDKYVNRDSLGLYLKMKNGEWHLVTLKNNSEEMDNTFEFYFQNFGYYSVRTQWSEGNGYKLINDQNGKVTEICGRPYFSDNGNYIISVNSDFEAGYSFNGFQLYKNENGKLEKLGAFETENWGPYSALWLENDKLILKSETVEFIDEKMRYIDFYSEIKIEYGG